MRPNAFLQRPKRVGVAFAHFAKGMTAWFGPTARICYAFAPITRSTSLSRPRISLELMATPILFGICVIGTGTFEVGAVTIWIFPEAVCIAPA